MENVTKSSLKTNEEVVADLKTLLSLVNDGKEGYITAAEATDSLELKSTFLKFSGERIVYATELKEHIATHGGDAENETGGILGTLHRTWLHITEALSSKDDKSLLAAIETGEKAAVEKYDEYIADYADHADHLELLNSQRNGILLALTQINTLKVKYQ